MLVYIILVLFILIYTFRSKISIIYVTFVLFILSAFRGESVGIDYYGYKQAFQREITSSVANSNLLSKFEIGWVLLNQIVDYFSLDFHFVIIIVSFVTIVSISYVSYKETSLPVFTLLLFVLLFYYQYPFSLIKQGLAISLFILFTYFYKRNKLFSSFILIFCFSIIHYSSFALIPIVYLAKKIVIPTRTVIFLLISTLIIGFLGFTDFVNELLALLPFEKYANYVDYKEEVEINRVNMFGILIPRVLICIYIFYYLKGNFFYKNLFLFGNLISNLFVAVSLFYRFALYFLPFEVFLLSNLVYSFHGNKRMFHSFIVLSYSLFYFVYYISKNRGGVIPYVFIF
ncbi:EpsG family protein [Lunatibacter salilacus]|uniref:EpsG family protein n=1 Tax=Lunatibacter salilacus TaxID=2483804 RepID=UPI00131B55A1|nr:EpsG family protein [Lunatibacter salilacus]